MLVVLVARGTEVERQLADPLHEQADFALGVTHSLAEAEALVAGTAEAAVLVPITAPGDPVLDEIAAAVGRGVRIGAVLEAEGHGLRQSAFAFGVFEALVAPFDRARVSAALALLVGRPLRRSRRSEVPFAAILAGRGIPETRVSVRNLSRGGIALACPSAMPIGNVMRIAIQAPPPFRLPLLFLRTIAEEQVDGERVLRAAFVGLTADERGELDAFVESLGPEVEDVGEALKAVRGLNLDRLRRGLASGVRLPALTALERDALSGNAPSDFCEVAVARCRAIMLSSVVDSAKATDQPIPGNLPFAAWWTEITRARDIVEILLERATHDGRAAELGPLRDLLARVQASAVQLDRVSVALTGRSLARKAVEQPVSGDTVQSLRAITEADLAGGKEHGTADQLHAIAVEAVEKDDAEKQEAAKARRPMPRWAVPALAIAAATAVAVGIRVWLHHDAVHDPAKAVVSEQPMLQSGPVRVRVSYVADDGETVVAIVDGSWYSASAPERDAAVTDLTRQLLRPPQTSRLEIHDYAGRVLRDSDASVPSSTVGAAPAATP